MKVFCKSSHVFLTISLVFLVLVFLGNTGKQEQDFSKGPQFVQANPEPADVELPDGSMLTVQATGDEVINYTRTIDGYTLLLAEDGYYYYAMLDKNGDLVMSSYKAKKEKHRSKDEEKFLKKIEKYLEYSEKQKKEKKDKWKKNGTSKPEGIAAPAFGPIDDAFPSTGNRNMLVILGEFSDWSFVKTNNDFNTIMNVGSGSFKTYYQDVSYGALNVTTTVVGPYQINMTMSAADSNYRSYVGQLIDAANNDGVNFANFDNNNDGEMDALYVIHAGYGEEYSGAPTYYIWSHSWSLSTYSRNYDGVSISNYATSPELRNLSGSTISAIGVIVHEFGHNIGVPDYYDTNGSTGGDAWDLGKWDVMAGGSWNDSGDTPAQHNMYTKWKLGWSNPTVIGSAATLSLGNTGDNNAAYRINTTTNNEFFILENRQQSGWDAYLPGSGLLIFHIDGNFIDGLSSNTVNATSTHQGVDIEEADDVRSSATYTGDPFPGSGNKTSFTDTTTPSSKSWAGANTNKPVTNISDAGGTVTFDFMGGGGSQNPPVAAFTASATTVEEGQSVTFTDQSTNTPTSWSWSFPGGTPSSSTAQNPTVTYNTAGTYNVTLTATNAAGSDDEVKNNYITVTEALDTVGNTTVYGSTSTSSSRRAMPFTMPEDGTISSVTMYHSGGSGGLIFGVYDGESAPANRLGVTASATLNGSAGWQTINLTSPAFVSGGTTVWLAWVYQSNPGIRYQTGSPGRYQSSATWSGGMPDPFGSGSQANYLYSIYASYTPGGGTVEVPVANFTGSPTTIDEGQSVSFTDTSTNNPTSWSWSFPGGTPSSSTAQNPTVTYNTAGTYNVTLTATNSAGSDGETKTNYITVEVPVITYCTSSASNQGYEWIAGVQVGSINNSSGASGYSDFTAQSATLTKGSSVSITLTPGFASGSYTEYWKIWIDLNGDGDFADSGEEVYSGSSSSVISSSFTVPTSASSGSTRMRVSMQYNSAPPYCGTFTYGEVEDYTVNLQ